MDFKIVIKCEKCRCSFELRPSGFSDRESLRCVNCGQELEQEAFSHLKAGLIELSKVPDVIPEKSKQISSAFQETSNFSIHVKEYSELIDLLGKE